MNRHDDAEAQQRKQQRRALMKPFEVLIIAGIGGAFVLAIVLFTLRDILLGLIFAGIAIVIILVVMALLLLNYKPNADVPVYLDRKLAESSDPGARGAALRPYDGTIEAEQADGADDVDDEDAR